MPVQGGTGGTTPPRQGRLGSGGLGAAIALILSGKALILLIAALLSGLAR